MEEKKKSNKTIIIILVLVIVAALGVIAYLLIDGGVFDKKDDNKKVENNAEEVVTDTVKYSRSKDIGDNKMNLYIDKDGKVFVKNLKTGSIKQINNITEKAKYLTVEHHCGGDSRILVLTEDGNLYINQKEFWLSEDADEMIYDDVISSYQKIETDYKFKEIVTIYDPNPSSTCGSATLYALTTTNELRGIKYSYENEFKAFVSDKKREEEYPFKKFLSLFSQKNLLFLYENGSIKLGSYLDNNDKYSIFDNYIVDENEKNVQISKCFYRVNNNTEKITELYLITKNNKMLKVFINTSFDKDTKLIAGNYNNKEVKKVSYIKSEQTGGMNKITITYTDNTEENFDTDSSLQYDYYVYEEI